MIWSFMGGATWSMTNIDQHSGSLQKEYTDFESRQDAVQTSTSFILGHQWSAKGLSSDPKKIVAVKR